MSRSLRIDYGLSGWKTMGAVVALVIVSFSVWQWLSGFSGPEYRGKPVRAWVEEEVMSNSSPNTAVIGDIGADAVPYLVNWLSYEEGFVKSALRVLQRWWSGYRPSPSPSEIRGNALYLLGTLGPIAKPAVPELIGLLETTTSARRRTLRTLQRMGPAAESAVPDLRRLLQELEFPRSKLLVVRAIAAIEGDVDLTLDYFDRAYERMVKQGNPKTVSMATQNLTHLLDRAPASAKEIVPRMTNMLYEANRMVRDGAVEGLADRAPDVLARIGPPATNALPHLLTVLERGKRPYEQVDAESWSKGPWEPHALDAVIRALGNIGPHSPRFRDEVFAKVMTVVTNKAYNDGIRKEAMRAACDFEDRPDRIVSILIQALDFKDWRTRFWAAQKLQDFGADAEGAVPDLIDALGAKKLNFRRAATLSLCEVDFEAARREDETVVLNLAEIVRSKSAWPKMRQEAIAFLERFTTLSPGAIDALKVATRAHTLAVRQAATNALETIND